MQTPILFIVFNRPEHTRRVLEVILSAHPSELFVFQDGAREGNEADMEKCAEVRGVVENLTKNTQVRLYTYYSDKNMGCGPGPASAISWFFSQVEQGIIIEDDALPHYDFFSYCEELLPIFKDDDSVRAIGSMRIAEDKVYGDGSYYFSMMNRTLCAWATWKRAWNDFDLYHRNVSRKQMDEALRWYHCPLRMREYWCDILEEVQKDAYHHSSWDQQFWMSIWLAHGKGIMPNVNLCSNIGFDEEATHTTDNNNIIADAPTQAILPLQHPSNLSIQYAADMFFQKTYFEPWNYGKEGLRRLPYRLNKRLKRLVGHKGSWFKKNEK